MGGGTVVVEVLGSFERLGSGDGSGYGYGYGDGSGDGSGSGYGYGYGYGYGDGDGSGDLALSVPDASPVFAWHVLTAAGCLRHDRAGEQVAAGNVITHDGEPTLCQAGLHASRELADAKKYGGEGVVTRVACSGQVKWGGDKLVCTRREVLEVYPAGYEEEDDG
jgi:hypothetical protein